MKDPKTLQDAIIYFADPDNCLEYMAAHRWPSGVICPTCGRTDVTFLDPAGGCGAPPAVHRGWHRVWVRPLALEWLPACGGALGRVSSSTPPRPGVLGPPGSLHRSAMANGSLLKMGGSQGGGPVEVDETFVGGKTRTCAANAA